MQAAGYGKPKVNPAQARQKNLARAAQATRANQALKVQKIAAAKPSLSNIYKKGPGGFVAATDRAAYRIAKANYDATQHPTDLGKVKTAGMTDYGVGKAVGASLKKDAIDARHGRITLNLALDAAALVSGGAGLAGRTITGARAIKEGGTLSDALRVAARKPLPGEVLPRRLLGDAETGTRKVTLPEGGSVQPLHQSPNIVTAAGQHAFDRLSSRAPELPGIGARARARRIIPEAQQIRDQRATADLIPLTHAAHKIGSVRGTTVSDAAYSAIKSFGHGPQGVALLDADVARREARLASLPDIVKAEEAKLEGLTGERLVAQKNKVDRLEREIKTQKARIKAWKSARPLVENPSPEIANAAALGKQASEVTTGKRVARGRVKPETAAEAVNRHARIASGAEFVAPTDARLGVETAETLKKRKRVVSLERRSAQADERVRKAAFTREQGKRIGYADEHGHGSEWLPDGRIVTADGRVLAPRGYENAQRLRSALSVARDELQTAQKTAEANVRPTGLVGAENVKAGPGAFYGPDVETRGRLNTGRTRSVNTPKEARLKQSQGTLFSEGRDRLGPKTTVEDALKEIRYARQEEDARLAHSFSLPYDESAFVPGKHELLNPEGHTIPRHVRGELSDLVPLDQMTPREIAKAAMEDRTKWAQHVFPASAADVPAEHRLGLRMVDKSLKEAITGEGAYASAAHDNAALRALDFANNINRAALIYLNPSYIPKNFAGNLGFLGLQQISPFLVAKNLRRSAQALSDLSPEQLLRIDTEVGGGAAIQLAHEGRGVLKAPLQKIADVQGAGADRLPRRAAWLYEASRHGYRTPSEIDALLNDAKLRPVLNEVSDGAQQAMVKFSRAPTAWRRAASRAIFIFPWLEGATRYPGRLILDRPFSARAASGIRDRIHQYQQHVFGKAGAVEAGALGGLIPIGAPHKGFGSTLVPVMNPMAVTPIGQASEVAGALKNAATGNWQGSARLISFLQPVLAAAFEAASGIDTYHGRFYPQGTGAGQILKQNLLGTIDRPAIPLAGDVATLLRSPQTQPFTGPAVKQPSYVQQGGPLAAIEQTLLGSARPNRQANIPALQAKGDKLLRANMSPPRRVAHDYQSFAAGMVEAAQKAGLPLEQPNRNPVWLRQAIRVRQRRALAYARLGLNHTDPDYQRKAWAADAQLLFKLHLIPKSDLEARLAWGKTAKPEDIKADRRVDTANFFGGKALTAAGQQIRANGGEPPKVPALP